VVSSFSGKSKIGEKIWKKPFTIRRKAGWKQLISILRMKTQLGLTIMKKIEEVYMITDFEGGLVIAGCNYDYPILVYDISRSDINYDIKKVLDLQKEYTET
jgi:hypothetical protein